MPDDATSLAAIRLACQALRSELRLTVAQFRLATLLLFVPLYVLMAVVVTLTWC